MPCAILFASSLFLLNAVCMLVCLFSCRFNQPSEGIPQDFRHQNERARSPTLAYSQVAAIGDREVDNVVDESKLRFIVLR